MVVFPIVTEYEGSKTHLIHEYKKNFIVKTQSETSTINPFEIKKNQNKVFLQLQISVQYFQQA